MADYRKLFEQELLKQQSQQAADPLQQKLESEIMRKNELSAMAPTVALSDQLFGTQLSGALPKHESTKDKLAQVLGMRQAAQKQRMDGISKLATMQDAREARAAEHAHKKDLYNLQLLMAKAKAAKDAGGGLRKLGGEDVKAVSNIDMILTHLPKLRKAVSGGNTLYNDTLSKYALGDNDATRARRMITEALGRLQSGGAISGDEEGRFEAMAGRYMDSPEELNKKFAELEEEFMRRRNSYMYGPSATFQGGAPAPARAPSSGLPAYDPSMSDEQAIALARMKGMI